MVAFLVGTVGMFGGALVAWQLVGSFMGPQGWKLAACLCSSYIG